MTYLVGTGTLAVSVWVDMSIYVCLLTFGDKERKLNFMDDIFEKADEYYETNLEKALALYSQAVKNFPENVRGHVGLARCYVTLNQFDRAVENAEKALELDSCSAKAYHVLTAVSIFRKERKNSFEYAEKAYSIDPVSYNSLINLGIVTDEIGDYEKSAELFEKALKLRPEDSGVRYKLIVNYLQLKKWDEAKLELLTLRNTHSSSAIFLLRLANSLRIKPTTLEIIIKSIIYLGATSIFLATIFFRYLFLVIVSEILILASITIRIKFGKKGEIGPVIILILFMLVILGLAVL